MSDSVQMNDKITASALQLLYLCDEAIELFISKMDSYNDDGALEMALNPPNSLECARDVVLDFFKNNEEDVIKAGYNKSNNENKGTENE